MMRVLALCALVAATTACQSDRNCARNVEFCSKQDNADGTQISGGICLPRPEFGEYCGSNRYGLTTKCMDPAFACTNADWGCCGACPSTTRATPPSTRAATGAAASTTRAAVATTVVPATTRRQTTTRMFNPRVPLTQGRQGWICTKAGEEYGQYLRHVSSSPYLVDNGKNVDEFSSEVVLKTGTFKITGIKKPSDCRKNGVCVAQCKNTAGQLGSGTVKVQCKQNSGWVVMAKRCNLRKKK